MPPSLKSQITCNKLLKTKPQSPLQQEIPSVERVGQKFLNNKGNSMCAVFKIPCNCIAIQFLHLILSLANYTVCYFNAEGLQVGNSKQKRAQHNGILMDYLLPGSDYTCIRFHSVTRHCVIFLVCTKWSLFCCTFVLTILFVSD